GGELLHALRPRIARKNRVPRDSSGRPLTGESAQEPRHRRTNAVRQHEVVDRLLRGDGIDGEDPSPAPLAHPGEDSTRKLHTAAQREVHGGLPRLPVVFVERAGRRTTGVDDEYV